MKQIEKERLRVRTRIAELQSTLPTREIAKQLVREGFKTPLGKKIDRMFVYNQQKSMSMKKAGTKVVAKSASEPVVAVGVAKKPQGSLIHEIVASNLPRAAKLEIIGAIL